MNKTLITLLSLGLAAGAAQAQEAKWAGFHAGLSLGQTTYTATWTDTAYDWYGGSLSHPKRKMTPSIQVGFDWQTGATVFGVELDHTFASMKREVVYSTRVGDPVDVLKTDELKSMTLLKGRMGLSYGNGLGYVVGGLGKVKANHTWIETGDPNDSWPTFSNDHTAFVWGFGMEHRVSTLLSIRAEYLKVNVPETSSVNVNRYPMEVGEDVSTFRVGASFHF